MSAAEDVVAWLRKADNDLRNIANNVRSDVDEREVPWDTVCFHAQQAAEKVLKAVLIVHGVTPPRTHDLVALLGHCVTHDPLLAVLQEDCVVLTQYGVAPRYPDDVVDPTPEEGREVVAAAGRVREAVRFILTRP